MDNCIKTIDSKYRKNLLLIDNTPGGFASKYGDVRWQHFPENIGISRAWNIGAHEVVDKKLDYLVVMSATMLFEKGMRDLVAQMEANSNPYGLETQHIWHLICIKRRTIERIGYFDENFYPAYYEDSDYIRRMELAGIHVVMSRVQRLPKVEIAAGTQGDAHAMKKSGLKVNMMGCRQYFIDKWGYEPRYESQEVRDYMYVYPFNNPRNELDYWEPRTIEELKAKYGV